MAAEKTNFEISRMARLLRVSQQGYYRWAAARARGLGLRAARRTQIDQRVRETHQASGGVYGAPRVAWQLRRDGYHLNVKTVAISMRRQGLRGVSPNRFSPASTIAGVLAHRVPDRVKRGWDTGELNRVWVSDITYLRTGEGWLFLCVVRDACPRRVLGWAMDTHQSSSLVERALTMAKTLRGDLSQPVVFHSDRGSQYTSHQLWQACETMGIDQSMGAAGTCYDNAMAESFFATLKTEFYDRRR